MSAKKLSDLIYVQLDPLDTSNKLPLIYFVINGGHLDESETADLQLTYDAVNNIQIKFTEKENKIIGIEIYSTSVTIADEELHNIIEYIYYVRRMFR